MWTSILDFMKLILDIKVSILLLMDGLQNITNFDCADLALLQIGVRHATFKGALRPVAFLGRGEYDFCSFEIPRPSARPGWGPAMGVPSSYQLVGHRI
jgi:hypothetical protein